jgi:septum site-determining protein MinC
MSTARQSTSFKFRGGSFHALVVRPVDPISGWLADVDALLSRSPGFFAGKSVVIDLSGLAPTRDGFLTLLDELSKREIRILGVEGADPGSVGEQVPFLTRGRTDTEKPTMPAKPAPTITSSLLIEAPVRSGQLIIHSEGDVTVVGSVASGAEIVAAGSIHVYGTLRGRVLAGAYGNRSARIFCRKLEAELMAIDGHYILADEIEAHLRRAPIQARLDYDELKITTMN